MKFVKTRLRSRLNEACKDKVKEQINEACKDKARPVPRI